MWMTLTNTRGNKYHQLKILRHIKWAPDNFNKENSAPSILKHWLGAMLKTNEITWRMFKAGKARRGVKIKKGQTKRVLKETNSSAVSLLQFNRILQGSTLKPRRSWVQLRMISQGKPSKMLKSLLASKLIFQNHLWMDLWQTMVKAERREFLDQLLLIQLLFWAQTKIQQLDRYPKEARPKLTKLLNGVSLARIRISLAKHLERKTLPRVMDFQARKCSISERIWAWSKKECILNPTKLLQLQLRQRKFNFQRKSNTVPSLMRWVETRSKSHTRKREKTTQQLYHKLWGKQQRLKMRSQEEKKCFNKQTTPVYQSFE